MASGSALRLPEEAVLYPLDHVRATLASIPHCVEIGLQIVEFHRGVVEARIEPSPRLAENPETGVVHSGVITTLFDHLGGMAAFSVARRGQTVATLDLRIDYLRMSEAGRTIFGRVECYRLSRSVAFVRGVACCDRDEPFAHCAATYVLGSVGFSVS